jgi:hypothetical protein
MAFFLCDMAEAETELAAHGPQISLQIPSVFVDSATLMAHISYFRLTHPDAEKDRMTKGPSTSEVRANARAQLHVCSACGENPLGTQLQNCAGVSSGILL